MMGVGLKSLPPCDTIQLHSGQSFGQPGDKGERGNFISHAVTKCPGEAERTFALLNRSAEGSGLDV